MHSESILSAGELEELLRGDSQPAGQSPGDFRLKLVLDFPLEVSVRLGKTSRTIGELLALSIGHVIELDSLVSEPAELTVNGKPIASGEVITIGEHFAVRIVSIIQPVQRVEHLR